MPAGPKLRTTLHALARVLVGPPGTPKAERAAIVLVSLAVMAGLLARAHGYLWDPPAFWLDECTWAMNLVEQPLLELCIRPIGFIILSRWLAETFSLSESVLRAMPWLAGMGTLLMAPPLARRLFENATARVLFVCVMALHPSAIDFSKEFKPYSISLALHVALVWLTLRYLESGLQKDLAWLLGVATFGGLFAQDLVFAYPGVFLAIGWPALKQRRSHLVFIVASAGAIVLLLLLQYFLIWSRLPASESNFWGDKYNVFFTGRGSYLGWWLERQSDIAGFPGIRRKLWHPSYLGQRWVDLLLKPVDRGIWTVLGVIGLYAIARYRRERALLLVLPLLTLSLFNALKQWPLGAFRANLFAVVYVTGIACMAFELPQRGPAKRWVAVPAFVLVFMPMLLLDPGFSLRKQSLTYHSEFPLALKTIVETKLGADPRSKEPLLLDRRTCDPFRYYTQFHPSGSKRLKRLIRRLFNVTCIADDTRYRQALMSVMPHEPNHVWTMLHAPRPLFDMLKRGSLADSQITYEERVGAHTLMALWEPIKRPEKKKSAKRRADPPDDSADLPEVSPDGRF